MDIGEYRVSRLTTLDQAEASLHTVQAIGSIENFHTVQTKKKKKSPFKKKIKHEKYCDGTEEKIYGDINEILERINADDNDNDNNNNNNNNKAALVTTTDISTNNNNTTTTAPVNAITTNNTTSNDKKEDYIKELRSELKHERTERNRALFDSHLLKTRNKALQNVVDCYPPYILKEINKIWEIVDVCSLYKEFYKVKLPHLETENARLEDENASLKERGQDMIELLESEGLYYEKLRRLEAENASLKQFNDDLTGLMEDEAMTYEEEIERLREYKFHMETQLEITQNTSADLGMEVDKYREMYYNLTGRTGDEDDEGGHVDGGDKVTEIDDYHQCGFFVFRRGGLKQKLKKFARRVRKSFH